MMRYGLLLLFAMSVACSQGPAPLPEGCQPLLEGGDCLLPWPSDFFRSDDVVRVEGAARIETANGDIVELTSRWNQDGFSRVSPIVTQFPAALSRDGLTTILDDPAQSVAGDHPTLIVNTTTFEPVPHFADIDSRADGLLTLYPVVPLEYATEYLVVVRSVRDASGKLARSYDTSAVRNHLESASIDPATVQQAWTFTTATSDGMRGDMLAIRELTRAWLASNTPTVTVEQVEIDPKPSIWKVVHGTLSVPLFLDSPDPMSALVRDADGNVVQNGETTFEFVAMIPASVRDSGLPGPALEYGHGFFGDRSEIHEVGGTVTLLTGLGAVTFGADWWGMSTPDVLPLINTITTDIGGALGYTDRVHQGMANWMVLNAAIRGPLEDEADLQFANGSSVYDHTTMSYLGISQGHILGGVLTAVEPDLDRVVLHVGGSAFTHMMVRSTSFAPFLDIISVQAKDRVTQAKFLAMAQGPMSRIDGSEYAPFLLQEPLEGARPRRVLMQIAQGDPLVPFVGSYLHARAIGIDLMTPSSESVFGLPEVTSPHAGSALSIYDFGIDMTGYEEPEPPAENSVHGDLRSLEVIRQQLDTFLSTGDVTHTCDGLCDPD